MGSETWSLTARLCDSCKAAPATLFCRADTAFLCLSCDCKIHAANKLASRHARVWVCEVCEHAPASVTCKADAAALCAACDRDIHSANPLARRHERFPVAPFYDSAVAAKSQDERFFTHDEGSGSFVVEPEEEAEAASWILATPNSNNNNSNGNNNNNSSSVKGGDEYLFNDLDSYLDLDMMGCDQKPHNILQNQNGQHQHYNNSDGVVPSVQNTKNEVHFQGPVVDGFPTYEMDFSGSKPFLYNFSSQSISQSVSSSSLDVGVVPDHSAMTDVSNTFVGNPSAEPTPNPVSGLDREARVLRYREKRKNRKFEKTIRYASRKAYAETRPRIKGRFAKRTEIDVDSLIASDASYGVVPSF